MVPNQLCEKKLMERDSNLVHDNVMLTVIPGSPGGPILPCSPLGP